MKFLITISMLKAKEGSKHKTSYDLCTVSAICMGRRTHFSEARLKLKFANKFWKIKLGVRVKFPLEPKFCETQIAKQESISKSSRLHIKNSEDIHKEKENPFRPRVTPDQAYVKS